MLLVWGGKAKAFTGIFHLLIGKKSYKQKKSTFAAVFAQDIQFCADAYGFPL